MRNLAIVFLMCGLACSPKAGTDGQIDYKMDTVVVDSKGGIIMGATNLFLSDFDKKQTTLYHYNNKTAEVEVIDLGNLSIQDGINLEPEGPTGVGKNVHRFYYLGDSIFVFDNYFGLSFLEKSSGKVKRIKYVDFEFFKELQEAADHFTNNFCFLNSGAKFISPVYSKENDFKFLALVDLGGDRLEKIEFEELKVINNFNVTLKSGNSRRSIIQPVNMLKVDDLIYISNSANNDIFTYHIQTQELKNLTIEANKLPAGKSGTYKKEIDNFDEFAEIFTRMYFEIEYKEVVRNPSNGNFYRFAMQKVREKTDELPAKFDIHLVAYDKEFKLLSETFMSEMNTIPQVYFWKDDGIWLHENIDDELAFVRLLFMP
ncbi:DUF4221 domain-containing protein [Aquiflexum sp. TKW24L]|uniref:DUF4221 family protein n=1 Tax=Aquiflexum sp. TKW24L TaxID=2942212 RepID=UPI0020C12281|nr:DUF4221 family protein [Aquiflexum sp. TKW24L]MCL6258559.1 DUF4221 domain-containing protein [Aquiflexum sp. TKW24L]